MKLPPSSARAAWARSAAQPRSWKRLHEHSPACIGVRRGDEPRFGAPQRLFTNRLRRPPGATLSSKPFTVSRDGATLYWLQAVERPGPDVIQVRTHAVQ